MRIPADQIGRLDVDALAQASGNAETFEKALAALGTAQPLYRADQSVRLSGDNIIIGTEMPFITNTRVGDKGQVMNTVQYQSIGASFSLAGSAGATGTIDLDLNIQVSSISDGGAVIAENVKVPCFAERRYHIRGPFSLASRSSSSASTAGRVTEPERRSPTSAGSPWVSRNRRHGLPEVNEFVELRVNETEGPCYARGWRPAIVRCIHLFTPRAAPAARMRYDGGRSAGHADVEP